MGTRHLWGNTTTYLWGHLTYGNIPLLGNMVREHRTYGDTPTIGKHHLRGHSTSGVYHLWETSYLRGHSTPGEHGTGTSDLWGHTNYR